MAEPDHLELLREHLHGAVDALVSLLAAHSQPLQQAEPNPVLVPGAASHRPVAYSPVEFGRIVGLRKDAVYQAIRADEIKATRFGRLYRIPASEVQRLFG